MNSSGPISLAGTTAGQSIEIENGGNGTTTISLNDSAVRTLAGVPSGAIIMPTNFYGKSNQYTYTVSTNQTNFCMRAGAVAAGWNGSAKLIVNINSGVQISSNATGTPAMTIQGSFPGGVTVTNNGTIVGKGGNGGSGSPNTCTPGTGGAAGGTALKVSSTVTFNNVGTLAGGGGGGGGGGTGTGANRDCCGTHYATGYGGGGGGGRSSYVSNSSGGGSSGGSSGNAGTSGSAGTGGCGSSASCTGASGSGGSGGNGSTWGSAGGSGNPGGGGGNFGATTSAGGSGGGGGKATCGAGTYITWTGTGTRYGSIS